MTKQNTTQGNGYQVVYIDGAGERVSYGASQPLSARTARRHADQGNAVLAQNGRGGECRYEVRGR